MEQQVEVLILFYFIPKSQSIAKFCKQVVVTNNMLLTCSKTYSNE